MRRRPVRHGWIINARNPIATLGIGVREVSENGISGTLAVADIPASYARDCPADRRYRPKNAAPRASAGGFPGSSRQTVPILIYIFTYLSI